MASFPCLHLLVVPFFMENCSVRCIFPAVPHVVHGIVPWPHVDLRWMVPSDVNVGL